MRESLLLLKTAPPRPSRGAARRPRLEHRWAEISDRTAILLTAPQGFGKTTLMAQWRRNWLAQGAYVAWATLDEQDEGARLVDLLLFALRAATGRESFAKTAAQIRLQASRELDALTELLAEVAMLATQTVVILDDAHRLPQPTLSGRLAYLINNAPPNLQFVIGSRRPLELQLTDLLAAGRLAAFDERDLRMGLDEVLTVLRARFGARIGLDDAVRLHDLTEGWPLGLQLAASTIEKAVDLHETIGRLSARRGDLQRFFFESLMSRLTPDEAAFLIRISILDSLTAEACEAVTANPRSASYLMSLVEDSPIMVADEERARMSLHALARDFLLGQFDKLDAQERRACHRRAAAWCESHAQIHEAARHALAAGDEALAVAYISQCLADIAREGRLGEAHEWIRRLSPEAMSKDVRLQLTVTWITAMSDEAASVPALLEPIARHPQFDEECRFEAALILAASAGFRDQPGVIADALREWERPLPSATPLHAVAFANSQATLAFHAGDMEKIRQLLGTIVTSTPRTPAMRLPLAFSDLHMGLSYLMEGNPAKAIAVLQPSVESEESEMGRRSAVAGMLAGALAGALIMHDEPEQALATLADRLDVIERGGTSYPIILAYRTLATIALRNGEEARALDILSALHDLGVSRDRPRIVLSSLSEQIRLHALRGRTETAAELLERIHALQPVFERREYSTFRSHFNCVLAIATAYVELARSHLDEAEAALRTAADTVPASMRRGAGMLIIRVLLALVAHERGREGAREMLAEVLDLAQIAGLRRVIEEAHPRLASLLAAANPSALSAGGAPRDMAPHAGRVREAAQAPSGLLTPKEARVLSLLVTGKANKEIARAMDISETTVKWHLRNVFFKLNAATRKHAVDRARLLGLIEG